VVGVEATTVFEGRRRVLLPGTIRSERAGVEIRNTSRCAEIETRFPDLLQAIVASLKIQSQRSAEAKPTRRAKREPR
jgi:hypothetical protein